VPTSDRDSTKGAIAVGAAMLLFGTGGVFARLAEVPAGPLAAYRNWFGAALLWGACAAVRRYPSRSTVVRAAPAGVLFAVSVTALFAALNRLTVAEATLVVEALKPVAVLGLALILLRETPRRSVAAWSAVAVTGAVLVALGRDQVGPSSAEGYGLAIAALVAGAFVTILTRRARAVDGSLQFTACMFLVAATTSTPLVALDGGSPWSVGSKGWFWIAMLALVPGGVGYVLGVYALGHLHAGTVSVVVVGVPFVAACIAWPVFDEAPSIMSAVAGVATLVAAGMAVRAATRRPVPAQLSLA
jgi:drug/metabolite transporter (DMT)-like permease